MRTHAPKIIIGLMGVLWLLSATVAAVQAADPLPSWKTAQTSRAILKFVEIVTTPGTANFVPPPERIATFDNDGTLWTEHPTYTQLAFALDRVKALAPQHPEWRTTQPFKAVLDNDLKALGAAGRKRPGGAGHGHTCRHEHGRFRDDRDRLAG